jgi:hypothetical protein
MRDRDRRSIKEFMDEEAKLYAAEKEAKEKPIRLAKDQLIKTHRELYAVEKQLVGTGVDPDVWVDPATIGYTIPQTEADEYNATQCRLFIQSHPEFYNSPGNIKVVIDYFARNNVNILSALTVEKAVQRLAEFRLLEERPAPAESLPLAPLVTFDVPELTETNNYQTGIDPATGLEKKYTTYEVNRMSSDEYRRAFRVTKSSLALPNRNW